MTLAEILPYLLKGTWVTVEITLISIVLALLMAFLAGIARVSEHRLVRWIARGYVELFRGTSLLVQMFWIYYALPMLGVEMSAFTAGVLTLGLNIGAYGAEVVRGAILAVPKEQYEASIALNFTPLRRLWQIILPQAIPAMIPPFGNNAIELLKGTALVSLITLHDLTFSGQLLRNLTYQTADIFSLVLLLYFVIALLITGVVRLLERRLGAGLDRGGMAR